MAIAENKEHYIKAWTDHIIGATQGIGIPLIQAGKNNEYYDELVAIQTRLKELIAIAADNEFK